MAEPVLSFIYNHSSNDSQYTGTGAPEGDWRVIKTSSPADVKVYTGGGINEFLNTPTEVFGRREATIRPSSGVLPVPQVYIESTDDNIMYNVPLASSQPNSNRYVFGVYVDGEMVSDLYLEMWDDDTFSTTNLPTLVGTTSYSHSIFNAIRTTSSVPSSSWTGADANAEFLSGYDHRLNLKGSDSVQNEALYYSMYAAIPHDLEFTHDTPIEGYRYLYI